ncbi:MAG: PAS domain-containing protein [Deltaproteobacteria bacterium]|nr:PAS domain-containing protein [Deltaproteobacteria bacterium]
MEEPKALSEKIALSIDLTKELEVKRYLENAKTSLQVIFDSLEDGISVIDRKYEIIRVNKAILNIFGKRDFSEILGKKCGSFSK